MVNVSVISKSIRLPDSSSSGRSFFVVLIVFTLQQYERFGLFVRFVKSNCLKGKKKLYIERDDSRYLEGRGVFVFNEIINFVLTTGYVHRIGLSSCSTVVEMTCLLHNKHFFFFYSCWNCLEMENVWYKSVSKPIFGVNFCVQKSHALMYVCEFDTIVLNRLDTDQRAIYCLFYYYSFWEHGRAGEKKDIEGTVPVPV